MSLDKLSMQQLQRELDNQRLGNEVLLAKLHNDQKKFLRVVKHEEKKKHNIQQAMTQYAQTNANGLSVESAVTMKTMLQEHKRLLGLNEQMAMQHQSSKDSLWKGVTTNMRLLSEVNSLNKQIDAYHLLIAKKNREMILDEMKQDEDQKELEEDDESIGAHVQMEQNCQIDEDVKDPEEEGYICQSPQYTHDDPKAEYAQQLIAKNKRYREIMTLLREKVDELRECRKKMMD